MGQTVRLYEWKLTCFHISLLHLWEGSRSQSQLLYESLTPRPRGLLNSAVLRIIHLKRLVKWLVRPVLCPACASSGYSWGVKKPRASRSWTVGFLALTSSHVTAPEPARPASRKRQAESNLGQLMEKKQHERSRKHV